MKWSSTKSDVPTGTKDLQVNNLQDLPARSVPEVLGLWEYVKLQMGMACMYKCEFQHLQGCVCVCVHS